MSLKLVLLFLLLNSCQVFPQITQNNNFQIKQSADKSCSYTIQVPHEQTVKCGNVESQMRQLQTLVTQASSLLAQLHNVIQVNKMNQDKQKLSQYKDCAEILTQTGAKSGVYNITAEYSKQPMIVYCDMDTNKGGWTVIHRRFNGSVRFDRNWMQYKFGFGNPHGEYWLGNDNIYYLTNQDEYELRFDIENFDGVKRYAVYSTFFIEEENRGYKLHVAGYRGDVPDSFTYHNGKRFTTKDRDNDEHASNCADTKGGWWYGGCDAANFNGKYLLNYKQQKPDGTYSEWESWTGSVHYLKEYSMMIRPKVYHF